MESAIAETLLTQPALELVILFGSAVTNRAQADSDLDLAVDAGHRGQAITLLMKRLSFVCRTGVNGELIEPSEQLKARFVVAPAEGVRP